MKIRKQVIYGFFLYFFCMSIIGTLSYSENINKFLAVLTIAMSMLWVYKCINNTYLMIMSLFIAYSNYSIAVGIYLDKSLRPMYLYPQITDINVYGIGITVLFLTMLMLVLLTPKYPKLNVDISNSFISNKNENNMFFMFATIIFFVIVFLGYTRVNNGRGESSPLYEYGSIFLIVMFYFSAFRKKKLIICSIACLVYSLTSLVNGTRIEALICILIYVLCFFRKGIKPIILVIAMMGGIFAFNTVGIVRGNWFLLLKGDYSVFSEIIRNKLVFDTCTHAYFPMLCMIEEFNHIPFELRMHYFFAFILSVFRGQTRVVDADLIKVVSERYYHNFGGVTPGFFYVWFSMVGPIFFALLVRLYISFIDRIKSNFSELKYCILIYVVASVPRWYLYGPWSFTRGVLVCIVIFTVMKELSKFNKRMI